MLTDAEVHKMSSGEITQFLKTTVLPGLLKDLPFLKKDSLILFHGSAATDRTVLGSDVDIMINVPEATKARYGDTFFTVRKRLLKRYPVEISCSFSLEDFEPERVWDNDLLLTMLQESIAIYDPERRFPDMQRRHRSLPARVQKGKILSALWQLLRFRQLSQRHAERGNKIEASGLRIKCLKLIMILMKLRDGKIYNGKYLYQEAVAENGGTDHVMRRINSAASQIGSPAADDTIGELTERLIEELLSRSLIPKTFTKEWEEWPMKKVRYRIDRTLL